MSSYRFENWVIIKFNSADPHYRVLGGRSGSYLDGSSWRMNSGVTSVESRIDHYVSQGKRKEFLLYEFYGASGSCYTCNKESYGLKMNNAHVWNELEEIYGDKVELMDEDTDWLNMDWLIKA